MAELTEQVHLEDPTLEADAEPHEPVRPTSIAQTFQHLACLYIKYLQIFRRLERCYDGMVHPQKRLAVLKVLELVMRRVVELKHSLVKYNPPNPAVRRAAGRPEKTFPWEYVNLDDVLVDLKLPPETLDVPVPRYFREDSRDARAIRDKIVAGFMQVRHGVESIALESQTNAEETGALSDLAQCIEMIQRNERGRQGKERAVLVKVVRDEEKRRKAYDAARGGLDMDPDVAAIEIERALRGLVARKRAQTLREEELIFVGMKPSINDDVDRTAQLKDACTMRKQVQHDNKHAYSQALIDLKDVVYDEEGPQMRNELRGERTDWVTHMIETTKEVPEDLEGFYPEILPEEDIAPPKEDKKDKKAEKGKKGKKDEPEEEEELPLLQGKTDLTTAMFDSTEHYADAWEDRDEAANFAQAHDVELVKNEIREGVRLRIRDEVDEMLRMNLKKMKMQLGGKEKKPKKAKKPKKPKKAKGKKLPGEKIAEVKNLTVEEMLAQLVEAGVVNAYSPRKVSDLVGDFNYLGTVRQHTELPGQPWQPPDPSMAQLRSALTEYCILPLGSTNVASSLEDEHRVKSVMLYGPSGSGKTTMCEAIAHELGALMINISPGRVKGKFTDKKKGPPTLAHLIYTVAKDPAFAPVVVYMDSAEQFMVGGGKKAKFDKEGPGRFYKDLQTYKNAFTKDDRVLFVGCTCRPELGDPKSTKAFFDKLLYFPYPDYASRVMLWRKGIRESLASAKSAPREVGDFSTLAHVSEGFSAGAILETCRKVLTKRRVERLGKRPFLSEEFLNPLAKAAADRQLSYQDDHRTYLAFTSKLSGLDDERKRASDERLGIDPSKDKKKGKKKK